MDMTVGEWHLKVLTVRASRHEGEMSFAEQLQECIDAGRASKEVSALIDAKPTFEDVEAAIKNPNISFETLQKKRKNLLWLVDGYSGNVEVISTVVVKPTFPHYFKSVEHLTHIDVYRVIDLFGVHHPSLQHAVKKLLVAGGRGHKDQRKDIQEVIASCERFLQMLDEDGKVNSEKQ